MRGQISERRINLRREQHETRLSMVCDIQRNVQGPEIAPGYPSDWNFQPHLTDEPCYVWNLLYLLQGEFVFPERQYASGQLRALFRFGVDIEASDQIQNIRIAQTGDVVFPGPLNIFLVVPHSYLTLLVLRGVE